VITEIHQTDCLAFGEISQPPNRGTSQDGDETHCQRSLGSNCHCVGIFSDKTMVCPKVLHQFEETGTSE
jgi:hypothetical protein